MCVSVCLSWKRLVRGFTIQAETTITCTTVSCSVVLPGSTMLSNQNWRCPLRLSLHVYGGFKILARQSRNLVNISIFAWGLVVLMALSMDSLLWGYQTNEVFQHIINLKIKQTNSLEAFKKTCWVLLKGE